MLSDNKIPNRLINESSPYLLQHAHNTVDWYPWGEEAFTKAKTEDKPIFLSIGYSTCHWCHVMAHESFEDREVADVLNSSFVSIKVDREERPDIDEVYMSVCQAMTGGGGWPLTIIMTPDKKPFFAGTYLPKNSGMGGMGLIELMERVARLWGEDKEKLIRSGNEIAKHFTKSKNKAKGAYDAEEIIRTAYSQIRDSFDEAYGGFSHAPKFPTPHYLLFLLSYWKAYGETEALKMAEKTLECMYRGGIFDHAGYGFSRYSTDRKWLVPHFEKMLYDNALLMLSFTEAFAASGKAEYRDIARNTAEYMVRDLRAPKGAFYSAQDADSEGVEGKYYVWDYDELKTLLTPEELLYAEKRFGVTEHGNFEGKNILNLIGSREKDEDLENAVIKILFNERVKRVPPLTDTKISASWNGLAIEAFSRAGVVFGEKKFIDVAREAADFIIDRMIDGDGKLSGIYRENPENSKGFLSDFANFGNALISLYEASTDIKYLKKANEIADSMISSFWDTDDKKFYLSAKEDSELFIRPSDEYDGAMPSGNSSACMFLSRLYNYTGSEETHKSLEDALQSFLPNAAAVPMSVVHFISVLLRGVIPHRQVIISAGRGDVRAIETYEKITGEYDPFTTSIYYDRSAGSDAVFPELIQYKSKEPFAGYVCENFVCKKPVYSPEELLRVLKIE